MASDSLSIRPEALLRHRDFVRAVAKSLVHGEPAARPVPSARESREARLAAEDSEADLRERLGLQHKVVEAVLGLREPFRTVILLRYYAGLSPARIADRRGVSPDVVRDQLGRALDLLRERLDAAFEGGRAVWSPGLLALSRGTRLLSSAARVAILTGALALAIAAPALFWRSDGSEGDSVLAPELAPGAGAEHPGALPPVASGSGGPAPGATPAGEDAGADAPPLAGISREDLEAKSIPELVQVAVQVQRTLRPRMLAPKEPTSSHRALLAMPQSGLARLIHRGKLGSDDANTIGLRGGGCCFSFATRGQALEDDPDLVLQQGFLTCAGLGPGILDLGERRLEDLRSGPLPAPDGLSEAELRAWRLFWSDAGVTQNGPSASFRAAARALELPPAKPTAGRTYLVRGIWTGGHDLVAAFTPLAEDDLGWTIAWRVLKTWSIETSRPRRVDPYAWVPEAPAWMEEAGDEDLLAVLEETGSVAQAMLFEPPPEVAQRFSFVLSRPGTKLSRVLADDRYQPLVGESGGGCCFSFAKEDHACDGEPDMRLGAGQYRSALRAKSCGVFLDLGLRTLASVGDSESSMPEDLSEDGRRIWRAMWSLKATSEGRNGRAIAAIDEYELKVLGAEPWMKAQVGHTYLVRSILPGEHDVLAAFTTAARDEHGDWILWRKIWDRKLGEEPKKAAAKGKKKG